MEAITLPDTTDLELQSATMLDAATAIVVSTAEQDAGATKFLQTASGFIKEVQAAFKPAKDAAHKAHKEVCNIENQLCEIPKKAVAAVKPKIIAYRQEQERIRQAEESRLREVARKEEEERRLQQALELERAGKEEAVEQVLAAPIEAPPTVVPKAPTPKGTSVRESWKHRVINGDLVPRAYLMVDDRALAALARAMKSKASVAGVEFYDEGTLAITKG